MTDLSNSELSHSLIIKIKEVLKTSRQNAAQQLNTELLNAYWDIGRIIVEYEQGSKTRAEYGAQTLKDLSKTLTAEFGKGFSRSNLQNMRVFYLTYQKRQTLSGKLSWSHYCEFLSMSDENKRAFYEKETLNSGWSVRELRRQISTFLYERLLLSDGKTNKETVLSLAQHGIEMSDPIDMIKDPYVFEFLGIPENKPMMESDFGKSPRTANRKIFVGTWPGLYVRRHTTACYAQQHSPLCRYGFL